MFLAGVAKNRPRWKQRALRLMWCRVLPRLWAAPLRSSLPLTQRGHNRSITLLTASSETGIAEHDWQSLAKPGQVLAIYMGIHAAGNISAQLLDAWHDSPPHL